MSIMDPLDKLGMVLLATMSVIIMAVEVPVERGTLLFKGFAGYKMDSVASTTLLGNQMCVSY
jgi:hypothetical protein